VGDDVIYGGVGRDFLTGDTDNDLLFGVNGMDTLAGDDGDDTLNGGNDDDALYGYENNDILNGGAGNDTLDGGRGDDALQGAGGEDVLAGGYGSDTFVFSSGDGHDTVTDLTEAQGDHLVFSAITQTELAAILNGLDAGGSVIQYGTASVTLQGVDLGKLTVVSQTQLDSGAYDLTIGF